MFYDYHNILCICTTLFVSNLIFPSERHAGHNILIPFSIATDSVEVVRVGKFSTLISDMRKAITHQRTVLVVVLLREKICRSLSQFSVYREETSVPVYSFLRIFSCDSLNQLTL